VSKKICGIELLAGLCLAMIVVSGCTSSRVNLVDTEKVTVEKMASKGHVKIWKVYVYQEEEKYESATCQGSRRHSSNFSKRPGYRNRKCGTDTKGHRDEQEKTSGFFF